MQVLIISTFFMLQFTKEVDYGIRLISTLAKEKKGLLSLREFAQKSQISFLFLQRIAKKLREAGLVKSGKGAHGGYQLAMEFKKITLKQVVEALEGEYAVVNCLKSNCACPQAGCCESQKVFRAVNVKLIKYLGDLKLVEILGK